MEVLLTGALQIIQLPSDVVRVQRLSPAALQNQHQTLFCGDGHGHAEHLQRREHLAAHVAHRRAQQVQVPRGFALLPLERLHQGGPAALIPPGHKAQLFKG